MTSGDESELSVLTGAGRRRPRRLPVLVLFLGAVACLVIAVVAGAVAHADATRQPTAAQLKAAAALAVASRWKTMPAGQLFPATLTYSSSLLTTETARRVGISPQTGCATALEPAAAEQAATDRCRGGLRATYLDQLQGVLYTLGVLAFPNQKLAATFAASLSAHGAGPLPLQALALPGTPSARFTAAARQAATARQHGPYVVLTVAGYADGEPAGAGQQSRPPDFAPASQLAGQLIGPLTRPAAVNCHSPEWSC